jgi:hypothetical protein
MEMVLFILIVMEKGEHWRERESVLNNRLVRQTDRSKHKKSNDRKS